MGLNCALGAKELRPYLQELSRVAGCYTSAHPNAGLPNEFGEYDQSAAEMVEIVEEFAQSGLVNIIGGCCGTTPEHIRAIAEAVAKYPPHPLPEIEPACRLSGLEPFNITRESLFVNVGERCNVTGSARFKRLIIEEDYSTALEVALQQVENGAQIIDINMDEAMLDSEGHGALPASDCRRTGYFPRADYARLVQVGSHRSGFEMYPGQTRHQLNQPERR